MAYVFKVLFQVLPFELNAVGVCVYVCLCMRACVGDTLTLSGLLVRTISVWA